MALLAAPSHMRASSNRRRFEEVVQNKCIKKTQVGQKTKTAVFACNWLAASFAESPRWSPLAEQQVRQEQLHDRLGCVG